MEHDSRHESPSLLAYLQVVRRRKWIVLVCAILVPLTAYFLSARQPAQYQASAQVYLSSQDLAGALTGISSYYVDEERLSDTQASLAHVPAVARNAIDRSGVEGITPGALLGSTRITPQAGTNILLFTVTNGDPAAATRLATAYARAFTVYRGQLDSESLRTAREEVQSRLTELRADGEGRSTLAASLRDKEQQLATLEALQTSRTFVTRTAEGASQIAPTPQKNAFFGLALGLVLGLGLAFAVEALDTRVRTAHEVAERLGMPLLGRVPPPPKELAKTDRLAMIAQATGPKAEAFRMLRTNLDFVRLDNDEVRTILVTSAIEQEGKSTTAANLAVAEARAGRRVALVDLDLRRPYIDRFFGLQGAPGVTDVALGQVSLGEALVRIDLTTGAAAAGGWSEEPDESNPMERHALDVIVSGPLPPDPGEFVGTLKLGEILERLRAAYDLVIVDTAPVLRVGDAMTLARSADGILVVTRINLVRRPMLNELRRLLDSTKLPKLGFVVTGKQESAEGAYGYGYGYGSSYQARPEKPESSRPTRRERREAERAAQAAEAAHSSTTPLTPATPPAPVEPQQKTLSRRERREAERSAKKAAAEQAVAQRAADERARSAEIAVRPHEPEPADAEPWPDTGPESRPAERPRDVPDPQATHEPEPSPVGAPAGREPQNPEDEASNGGVESALDRIARIMEQAQRP